MYLPVLVLHSLLRWLVLVAGLLAAVRALTGLFGPRPWTPTDDRAGRLFTIALDVQVAIGLLLYAALSPVTTGAFEDLGAAMRNSTLRYWAVEHVALMLAALALAHVGRARIRRARLDTARHRQAAVFFGIALVLVFLAIPWPWMPEARPMFPFR
jgi:hypothetical protein